MENAFRPSAALARCIHKNGGLITAAVLALILFQICWVSSGILFTKMMEQYDSKHTCILAVVLIGCIVLSSIQDVIDMQLIPNLYDSMNSEFITATLETFETQRTSPNTGKVVSLFSHLHYNSVELFVNIREYMIPAIMSVLIGAGAFFYINKTLGLVFSAAVLVFAGVYAGAIFIMQKPGIDMDQCRLRQDSNATDMLLNMHNIFAVNNTRQHLETFRDELKQCKNNDRNYFSSAAGARALLMIALTLVFVATLVVLLHLSRQNKIPMTSFASGVFILAFIREYLFSTVNHLGGMSWYSSYLIQADRDVQAILRSDDAPALSLQTVLPANNIIVLQNVLVADTIRLPDITINSGDRLVLRGPIGSGKSTLLNVLFGKLPYTGSVTIGGVEVRNLDITVLRDYILLVPQTVSLFQNTLYYNIAYGNNSSREQVQALLDKYNLTFATLDDDMGRLGERLSGGQRQLVFLLRALLRKDKIQIVLMDEPTSALDTNTRKIALQIIEELIGNHSAVLVTHDPALEAVATQVLHLQALDT